MAANLRVALLVELLLMVNPGSSVAPEDEEQHCELLRAQGAAPIPAYSANMRVLMDSWNYQNLLPPRAGAVWEQVDNDTNNHIGETTNVCMQLSTIIIVFSLIKRTIHDLVLFTMYLHSGFRMPTFHANNLSKCVGSALVHRITG